MKILSNSEYEKLVAGAQKSKSSDVEEVKKLHNEQLTLLKREKDNLIEDHKIAIERKEAGIDLIVQAKLKEANKKIQDLTIENNNNKKEVEILTKAFENLGFDVKDMKSILDKLVDGLVSKNTVNVIK